MENKITTVDDIIKNELKRMGADGLINFNTGCDGCLYEDHHCLEECPLYDCTPAKLINGKLVPMEKNNE